MNNQINPTIHAADPSDLLATRFARIYREQMQGTPIVNDALSVRAMGFCLWQGNWVGVLLTPWFMNLLILPGEKGDWPTCAVEQSVEWVFPCGTFNMTLVQEEEIGTYLFCSLSSPMSAFENQQAAEQTAIDVMHLLFDEPHADANPATKPMSRGHLDVDRERPEVSVSRRSFLRGAFGSGGKN